MTRQRETSRPLTDSREIGEVSDEVLGELVRRVQDIDATYRDVARKMGQLYLCADANHVASLTRTLDRPMRNTSDDEQAFADLLEQLRGAARRRK